MQTAPEQDGSPAAAKPTPLFRIDPGWPFVIAGLLLLVAGVLIPAQRDLQELRNTLEIHRALEDQSIRQLAAYDRFINDLEHGDEQLVGRLAASQLNLMPKDERSMLLVPTLNATVTQWIEDSEPAILPNPPAYPDTLLSRLATGPRRLWVLACGAFLVFVGLMLSPSAPSSRRPARMPAPEPTPDPIPTAPVMLAVAAPAAAATSSLVVVDDAGDAELADASSEEHAACAVETIEAPVAASRLDFSAAEAVVEDLAEDVVEDVVEEPIEAEVESEVEAEVEAEVEVEEMAEEESVAEVDAELEAGAVEEDECFGCVDGEAMEMPAAVLAADADAVCMSAMTRASEAGASIIELKPAADDGGDSEELPVAEAGAMLDGAGAVESVARAETEALPGEVDGEGEEESVLPAANDRALDSLSLFHGLSEDRWISTGDRA
jgi:hypothetical protein